MLTLEERNKDILLTLGANSLDSTPSQGVGNLYIIFNLRARNLNIVLGAGLETSYLL